MEHEQKPWYRHLWPWLLMIPPGAAVAGGMTLLYLSMSDPYTLAVVQYDQIEDITAQRFAQDQAAWEQGLTAGLELSATNRDLVHLRLHLEMPAGNAAPDQLVIRFTHATRDAFDRTAELIFDGERYLGEAALMPAARYQVEVLALDGSWRLAGVLNGLANPLRLEPQRAGAGF